MASYVRLDLNRLTLGEIVRHTPSLRRALVQKLMGVFGLLRSPAPLPHLTAIFAELRVEESQLSERCRAILGPAVDGYRQAGFEPVAFAKLPAQADPSLLDSGSCYLLHRSGEAFGVVSHVTKLVPPRYDRPDEATVLAVSTAFASGKRVTVSNSRRYLDPIPGHAILVVTTQSPAELFRELETNTKRMRASDRPVRIAGVGELAALVDAEQTAATAARVRRGLYAEMTVAEVEAAWAHIERLRTPRQAG